MVFDTNDKIFAKYYDMWDKYGVKLSSRTSRIEITKEIFDQVNGQSEVCDIIWAINAANQSNKSPEKLSKTAIDKIRALSPLLLNHRGRFGEYHSGAEVENRAVRHFTTDPVERFRKRQPKIRNVLESYDISKNLDERTITQSVIDSLSQGEIPTWREIQTIYRQNSISGESIAPNRLKELIANSFQKQDRKLHLDWWEETKKILRNESERQRPSDKNDAG